MREREDTEGEGENRPTTDYPSPREAANEVKKADDGTISRPREWSMVTTYCGESKWQ